MTSPFDRHLIDIYAGRAPDGLVFFSEHGYYDVSDTTNTVQMFRDNVGRDDFWHDRESYDDFDPFERPTVYPFGSQSKVPSSRMRSELHRTNSGRFTLLDDDGNPVSEDDLLEMEREDRLKVKSLELDDDDLAELESEQATVESAIEVIRVEKYRFQRVLFRAFYEPENGAAPDSPTGTFVSSAHDFMELPPLPSPVALLDLPPYCGNLFDRSSSFANLKHSKQKNDEKITMMEQLKEQSKKASDKLEEMANKGHEAIDKVTKQTKDSINKSTKKKDSKEDTDSSFLNSAKEAFHIDIKEDKKDKKKPKRKDSSDSDSDEEEGLLHGIGDEFDDLTLNQRMLGAVGCYILSGLFAFAATVMLFTGVHHVRFYALFYSLSNIATFCSLIFIMGQERLQKRMLSRKRSTSGSTWMGALALTVIVAFLWPSHWFIVILLLIAQFCGMIWYSASYIPFGRKFLHKYAAKRVILVDAMDGKIDGK
ncbi:hypothetical protein BBO99_00009240 [Phytophthora kernoviae]|uniref:Vesicle transport protein n=1 Tax=Phytophthora kernoviae TaxID=325452 RepID=A0A3R7JZX1_9STRA|nr:hypothetical protein JM16_008162 [Phytophthora kernoviae]RLN38555.1 hypothetical protein BBI17_009223 [Phytophthora kernoviae]RLN73773.1 hypothetical protein BBO99_00009240 [Phytophthora kernoviae]